MKNMDRQELLSLLSICATLAGLCITIVALMAALKHGQHTVVDDFLAGCAAAFVTCIYLIVWLLRIRNAKWGSRIGNTIEVLFLGALTIMTIAAFIAVYSIW